MTEDLPKMELRFIWQHQKYCLVTLNGQFVIVMNRDVHGLGEMRSIQLALLSVAGIAGWSVTVEGEEGF